MSSAFVKGGTFSIPALEHDRAGQHPDICEQLRSLAVQDAGGEIPEAFAQYVDKPGCTPFLE